MEAEGQIVLSTSDAFGNILVIDYQGYRVLTFDSPFVQSGFYLEQPFAVVHEYISIMVLVLGFVAPRHVTVLGLGGGSLLRSLHHALPRCHFQVAEIRAKVRDIARDFFFIPMDDRVTISITDAQSQLEALGEESTDIVFSDLYDADVMSPVQAHEAFVRQSGRVLCERGWLVASYHELPKEDSHLMQVLREQFAQVWVCPGVIGNFILFASKAPGMDLPSAAVAIQMIERDLATPLMPLFERLMKARGKKRVLADPFGCSAWTG